MALFLPSVDSFLQAGSIKISSQMDTVTKLKITGRNYQKTESSFKKFCQQMDVPKVKSVSCTITFFLLYCPPVASPEKITKQWSNVSKAMGFSDNPY